LTPTKCESFTRCNPTLLSSAPLAGAFYNIV
jgi:hypothetical protein